MGSLFTGIGNAVSGLFGGGGNSVNPNYSASSISGLNSVANQQSQLAGQLQGQGSNIYGPAFGQYNSGISGTLTPAQDALVGQNLSTMDTTTSGAYGNLGLGGSTMEGQDLAGNSMRSLAEQSNINFQNESLGLQGLQEALGYFGGAGQELGGTSQSLSSAGQLQNQNQAQLNAAINSLGNKSAGGLGSGIQSLLGGGAGAAGSGAATGAIGGNTAADLGGAAAGAVGGATAADLGGTAAVAGGADAASLAGVSDLLPLLLAA